MVILAGLVLGSNAYAIADAGLPYDHKLQQMVQLYGNGITVERMDVYVRELAANSGIGEDEVASYLLSEWRAGRSGMPDEQPQTRSGGGGQVIFHVRIVKVISSTWMRGVVPSIMGIRASTHPGIRLWRRRVQGKPFVIRRLRAEDHLSIRI